MPTHPHCLVQIWQTHEDGAPVPACTHDQHTDRSTPEEARRQRVLDAHLSSLLRARIARGSGAGRSGSPPETVSLLCQAAPKPLEAAFVPHKAANIGMSKGSFVEAPLPVGYGLDRSALWPPHRSCADRAAV